MSQFLTLTKLTQLTNLEYLEYFDYLYLKYFNQDNLTFIWTIFTYLMVTLMIIIHLFPRLATKLCSNPYPQQLHRQFGPKNFNLQLMNIVLYHQGKFSWLTHSPTLLADVSLWTIIIFHNYQWLGLILLSSFSIIQLASFRDFYFGIQCFLILSFLSSLGVLSYGANPVLAYNLARGMVIIHGCIRACGHLTEKLPPFLLSLEDRSKRFSYSNMEPYVKSGRGLTIISLGVAQEAIAGMPGRLAPYVIYVLLFEDHISDRHQDLSKAYQTCQKITDQGWRSDSTMGNLFSWVFEDFNPNSERAKERTKHWMKLFWFEFLLVFIFGLVIFFRPVMIGGASPTMIIFILGLAFGYYRQLWRGEIVSICYQQETLVICHLMLIIWFGLSSTSGTREERLVMVISNILIGFVRLTFLDYYIADGVYDP